MHVKRVRVRARARVFRIRIPTKKRNFPTTVLVSLYEY